MAKVGAQRAAILTGKSKSTIQRAMNAGKLSYEIDAHGRRVIDVSELERAFGLLPQNDDEASSSAPAQGVDYSQFIADAVERERMIMHIKMLEYQLQSAHEHIEDLKIQRDKWEKQATQMLITSQHSQKQADELRAHIKEREERARQKRLQQEQQLTREESAPERLSSPPSSQEQLKTQMRRLKAENQNFSENNFFSFLFGKKAKTHY